MVRQRIDRRAAVTARAGRKTRGTRSEPRSRLLIVDDHSIFRLGLRALLSQEHDLEVVADAGSAAEALQRATESAVDVVITDLALPGGSGLDLLAELHKRFRGVRTLVLTGLRGDDYVRSCLAAGATGYALKSSSHAELLEAIRSVRVGERFLCKAVSSRIVTGFLSNVDAPFQPVRLALISPRERDILTRVATGQQNRQIADDLGLSIWTVRKYRQSLMRKFALRNAAAVTSFAIGHGFVSADAGT
jgi:DNA-binding NarL/FixJ family response regulator